MFNKTRGFETIIFQTPFQPPHSKRSLYSRGVHLRAKEKEKKEESDDETRRFTRKVVTITQRARYRQRADKVECHDRWE